jgi:hypothetical protein
VKSWITDYEKYYFKTDIFLPELYELSNNCLMAKIKLGYPYDELVSQYKETFRSFNLVAEFTDVKVVDIKYLLYMCQEPKFRKFLT